MPSEIRISIRNDAPVLIFSAAYIVCATMILYMISINIMRPRSYVWNVGLYFSSVFILLGTPFLKSLAIERPQRPFSYAVQWANDWQLLERMVKTVPVLALLIFFMPAFSAIKSAIPLFNPYGADDYLIGLDYELHGDDPWRLIHPLVGFPIVSFILNIAYHFWIILLYAGVVIVAGWLDRPVLRLQFLMTYVLSWVLVGNVAAILLSSVGPCFYDDFHGGDRFKPLMAYLAYADSRLPLEALDVQDQLLAWALSGQYGLGRGISAMPSMHVAIACLFAILGWHVSRFWGVIFTAFLGLIMVGSVHLGYHYAVDGYASIVAVCLLWAVSGLMARRHLGVGTPSVQSPPELGVAAPAAP